MAIKENFHRPFSPSKAFKTLLTRFQTKNEIRPRKVLAEFSANSKVQPNNYSKKHLLSSYFEGKKFCECSAREGEVLAVRSFLS